MGPRPRSSRPPRPHGRPRRVAARHRPQLGRAARRRPGRRAAAAPPAARPGACGSGAAATRPGRPSARRAAFSAMSPACGQATTGTPQASARATVPWPAWQTTAAQRGIVARVGHPVDQPRVGGHGERAGGGAPVAAWPAPAPARRPAPRARRAAAGCSGSCEVLGATSTSGSSPGGRLDLAEGLLPQQRAGHPQAGHRSRGAGTRAGGRWPPAPAGARSRRGRVPSGGSPTRARAPLSSRRPCSSPRISSGRGRAAHSRAPDPRARADARPPSRREARARPPGARAGTSVAQGRSSSSAASAAATVRMSATTTSGSTSWISAAASPARPARRPA